MRPPPPAHAPAPPAPTAALQTITYRLITPLPAKLRFRNGDVALEITRDCSADLPTWVLRARRLVYGYRVGQATAPCGRRADASGRDYAGPPGLRTPLPTVSPASMAVPVGPVVVLAASQFGKRDLQARLRGGFEVEAGSAAVRVCEALVRGGFAVSTAA